jgi:predicted transcriptional regulator
MGIVQLLRFANVGKGLPSWISVQEKNVSDNLKEMTTDIVSSYVTSNTVAASELPALIHSVFKALSTIDAPEIQDEPAVVKATTAQIKKSIRPDGLVSFEDGKTYKTLKRHLTTRGLTVAQYKEKWGLPGDYPSTSPDYSARRSEMARSLGLGQRAAAKTGAKRA